MKQAVSRHEDRVLDTAKRAFIDIQGVDAAPQRAREIAALPAVNWKGRALYTVRCDGPYGKGPHDVNLPESVLWALIDVRHCLCPYHR